MTEEADVQGAGGTEGRKACLLVAGPPGPTHSKSRSAKRNAPLDVARVIPVVYLVLVVWF